MFVANILSCLLLFLGLDRVNMIQRNVALGKPTTQRRTYLTRYSHKAVDGKLFDSCADTSSWWVVDLYHHYHIHTIRVSSVGLTKFYVFISRHNPVHMLSLNDPLAGDLCFRYPGILPSDGIQTLPCDSKTLQGRFVYVWGPKYKYMGLCEVEILVDDIDDDGADRIKKRQAYARQIHPGTRSAVTPIYSKALTVVSPMACCWICLSEPASEATHFQINLESRACECIQDSDFDDQDLGLSPDVDWDLWDMQVLASG